MRVSLFFYDVPKNGWGKVKFFREFYGMKQRVRKKLYGGDGFLISNKIKSYKPGDGAIMIDSRYKRKVEDFLKGMKIKNEVFELNIGSRYFRDNFK